MGGRVMDRIRLGLVAAGVLAVALVTSASYFTIDQGERGVVLRFGAINRIAEPGLGFKIPGIDTLVRISTQNQTMFYEGIDTYSRDQQSADIDVSVIFRVPPENVAQLYTDYGSLEEATRRLVDRRLPRAMKEVFGEFTAATSIQERARLGQVVEAAVQQAINDPFVIESVQMERISFSNAYEKSVEERMLAEVEVLKLNQNAAREKVQAEIAVTQAQAKADASLAQATAEAKAILLRGEADAEAMELRGTALAKSPELVRLMQAEKWNGVLPVTMVPGATVPFLEVK
jgi:regulator of protease activity HflC (stomatin/prohibitin superfamily)